MSARASAVAGEQVPPREVGPLTQSDVLRFAGACGDFNPLHHDPAVAAHAGFAAPIVMGQMTAGIVAAWISDWCGIEHLLAFEVRFRAPVLVGDRLVMSGEIVEVEAAADGGETVRLAVEASTGSGVVLTARAVVGSGRLPRPPD